MCEIDVQKNKVYTSFLMSTFLRIQMPSEFKPSSQVTKQHPINFIKSFIFTIFLKIVKSCFHLLTGRSAIERLLQDYEKLQKERSLTGPTFQSLRRAKKDATKAEASNEDRSRVPEKDGSESRVAHTGETDPSTDCGISSLDRTMLAIKLYNELKSSKLKQLNQAAYFLNGQSTKNKKTSENNSSNLSFTSPEEVIETIDSLKVKKYSKNLSSSPNHSANIQNSNFNNNLRTEESITLCNLKNLVITCYNYGEVKRILKDIQYERYNKDDEDHERKLMEIWDNCCIEKLEGRISKQWDYWSLGATFLTFCSTIFILLSK